MTTLFYAVLLLVCSVLADQSVISSVFRATHNSYSGNLEGAKNTIQYQLDHGVRMIEFDIWDNSFEANKDYSIGHTGPGNAVDHSSPNPSSSLLRDWLRTVNTWSAANPTHAPIQLMLDIKSDLTDNANYAAGNLAALNQAMKDVLGDKLVWAATAPAGLPSVDALRGKILPVLSGDSTTRSQYGSDAGKNPSVARNNKGQVIEVHDDGLINIWYWSGKVQSDGTVKWLRHGRIDTGVAISVAINDDGWIVEVHRSQKAATLWSRVGKFDDETAEITWWPATKYDNGVQPSVAFTGDKTLREVHQSQLTTQRWQWTGTLDTAASPPTVRWTSNSKTSDAFLPRSESNGITVYRDADLLVAYSCGSIVGKRIAYEQIFFVEFQPGNAAALSTGLVYGGASTNKNFVISGRNSKKLVRAWDFDSADRATTPLANYPATNHPYDAWYESLMKSNNAIQ